MFRYLKISNRAQLARISRRSCPPCPFHFGWRLQTLKIKTNTFKYFYCIPPFLVLCALLDMSKQIQINIYIIDNFGSHETKLFDFSGKYKRGILKCSNGACVQNSDILVRKSDQLLAGLSFCDLQQLVQNSTRERRRH